MFFWVLLKKQIRMEIKVEQFIFNGVIPKDKFFVMGTHPRSFDSRYWGFVDRKDIKGVSIWAI